MFVLIKAFWYTHKLIKIIRVINNHNRRERENKKYQLYLNTDRICISQQK